MSEPNESTSLSFQASADRAIFGICETLALLFVLPFGEDLYNDKTITGWHVFYLVIGLLFAGAGPMFPWIRTRIPESISISLSRAALDARIWIAALLILYIYVILLPNASNTPTWLLLTVISLGFISFGVAWIIRRRFETASISQNASIEITRPILAVQNALVMHICRIHVTTDALDKDLYLDIDVVVHNGESDDLLVGQLSGRIRFDKIGEDFPNSPVAIHDYHSPNRLPRPEFTFRLRQWMPRDFANEIIQVLEAGNALILTLQPLTIPVYKNTEPEVRYRLPIWDGIRLCHSIDVGKVVHVGSNLYTAQRIII
jgi:hypothetical protein